MDLCLSYNYKNNWRDENRLLFIKIPWKLKRSWIESNEINKSTIWYCIFEKKILKKRN